MKNFDFRHYPTDTEVAHGAARVLMELLTQAQRPQSIALSGGRIAADFYTAVVEEAHAQNVSLREVDFFFADERCVPPDDAESNYRLANEFLFQPLAIALDRIHRLEGEIDPIQAVEKANADLLRVAHANGDGLPALDLVILGIGPDGHTASLMPNTPPEISGADGPYVYVDNSPKPPPERMTLTYSSLARARNVWTLVTGSGKENALRQSLQPGAHTPFGRVLESRKMTSIFSSVALS